jgi:branched-chain amino acid aminotransferase
MKKTIFFNGKFIPEEKAVVPVTTHALHYGTGCFEGIRAYYSAKENALMIFRMRDHYKRLLNSIKVLYMGIPYSLDELCEITVKLLEKNFQKTDIYIRPLVFKSDPAIGNFNLKKVKDSLIIYAVSLGRHYEKEGGVSAKISSWRRVASNAIPPRAKITGSYANTCLAKTESFTEGYDEAIFLDQDGYVVEGSAENIFLIKNKVLITPPSNQDILVGITRDTILKICKNELGLKILEKRIKPKELYESDEVLLVGTGAEVAQVTLIDKKKIGGKKISKNIGLKIKNAYFQIVHGENPRYQDFLTKVPNK